MPIHKARDNSFKLILADHQFFVSFLHDFVRIDAFKNVLPDDIEDITERFLPLFQENRDSDTIKRINLKDDTPFFVIAIVEHESKVNYRIPFKMLQYITLVLDDHEKSVEREHPGITLTRDFRYPPVLPIVFYDGPDKWTAVRNFADRTSMQEVFGDYIPSFRYLLVDLNKYSQEDVLDFNDCLSLVMLIARVHTRGELIRLKKLPKRRIKQLTMKIPESKVDMIRKVITVLLIRLGVSKEDRAAITDRFVMKKEDKTMFDALVEDVLEDKRLARDEGIRLGEKKGIQVGEKKGRNEGIQVGERKGSRERALETARRMKEDGFTPGQIRKYTELSLKDIRGLGGKS